MTYRLSFKLLMSFRRRRNPQRNNNGSLVPRDDITTKAVNESRHAELVSASPGKHALRMTLIK